MWSTIFNDIFKNDNKIRINQDRRQFIDTWIRAIEEIPHEFNIIKESLELAKKSITKN